MALPSAPARTGPATVEDVIAEAERLHREAMKRGEVTGARAGEGPTSQVLTPDVVDEAAPEDLEGATPDGTRPEATQVADAAGLTPRAALEKVKVAITDRIRRGETLGIALVRHGVPMDEVNELCRGLKGVLDVRAIRPGDAYTISEEIAVAPGASAPEKPSHMQRFEFRPKSTLGAPEVVVATLSPGKTADGQGAAYHAARHVTPVTTKVVALSGEVDHSLYMSMKGQGEGSALVNAFADVFAWNIDFYRETRKGDHYKVVVEKRYADGRFVGYGKVLAAEYVNAGEVYRGFNFKSKDGKVLGIFAENGDSLERTFLKSPMEVTRMTSSYGQRFHPVLKRWKAHNGIDYGAPTGTPFWAVADGVVEEAHYSNTAGNMIVLRHAQGYTTEYFHASKFAKGLKKGMKVRQREVIGYVGSTGRSTGPHLHFGMQKHGGYVDPKKQSFPAAKPVPSGYLEEFVQSIAHLRAELDALEIS